METIILKFIESSPVLGVFVVVIYFLFKRLTKTQDDHLDSQKERIKTLENHAELCEKDRTELHKTNAELSAAHARLQHDVIEKILSKTSNLKD